MRRIQLELFPVDKKQWLRKKAREEDTATVYSEPGVYCIGDRPVIIYGRLGERYDKMLWAVKSIGFQQEVRSANSISRFGGSLNKDGKKAGLGSSRVFGFRPPVPFNPAANFCSVASSAITHPAQHHVICDVARMLDHIYSTFAPEVAADHSRQLKKIRSEWILPGTRFTSGIVNRNNPLKYHFDRGNLLNVMSCMLVFRQYCEGGYLSIPEFGGRWLLDDHSFFLFDGQTHLHGVTPIKRLNKHSYRYSVVYYALRAMEKCGTVEEEISRARTEKRAREKRRV